MGIFSRFSDIINSNINALLDKAEDPEKLVKLIISEMEQTLIEVRSTSVQALTDKKELRRQLSQLEAESQQWANKAELAVSKGREDLAKSALQEKHRLEQAAENLAKELELVESSVERLETDISRLQAKLDEALSRRDAMILRQKTVAKRKEVNRTFYAPNFDQAFEKFEAYEKRLDQMEAEVEAMELGRNKPLKDEIDELVINERVDQELNNIKQKVASQ
ncbi:MAG: phage shock protein PspA [Gammaproteobacteria bacterium]|nr:phage shock protein PspA [Gammaproteobacteria bacterium]